jgi:threonine synthase
VRGDSRFPALGQCHSRYPIPDSRLFGCSAVIRYTSTAGAAPPADLRTALAAGLAPDGGLYLPDPIPAVEASDWAALRDRPLIEAATFIGRRLFGGDVAAPVLDALIARAMDFPVPLVRLTERVWALELYHGPTGAFKDVGARVMAGLLDALIPEDGDPLTILTATSGDTGGAVADAFFGRERFRVVVLYPEGQVSTLQERQFTTLGGNVIAVRVSGTFDDCQRLVKAAFTDRALRERCRLTSANSINVGRLLPQVFYYTHWWARLDPALSTPVVSVPCGNFGNLTAGLIARRLGVPIGPFIAVTNANDVVPEYFRTGRFVPRASRRTISNAMDVGNPSNFARVRALYRDDVTALRRDVSAESFDDDATRGAIRDVYQRHGYVMDPHSAVAYLGLEATLAARPDTGGVFLATAHPAKFREVVEPVIGCPVPLPERLAARLSQEPTVRRIRPAMADLLELLTSRP